MPQFKPIFLLIFLLMTSTHAASHGDCVILLHGLARSHHAMSPIAAMLEKHGYVVVNQDYPSTKKSIQSLANEDIQPMVNLCLTHYPEHIMFITHSLGGVVLKKYLETHEVQHLSHIVMLSPPNHGSPLADLLHHHWLFKKIMGPAGQELLTTQISSPFSPKPNVQIGIIAGSFNLLPFSTYLFKDRNDGKVSVSSAKMPHMNDFIVLPVGHTLMMNSKNVQQQILYFLRFGKFSSL